MTNKETENTNLEKPPPDWGSDGLSEFIELAYKQRWATFYNKKQWFQRLTEIDSCFVQFAKGWTNPGNSLTPLLFLRCHAAYRATCEHAMAGQNPEAFVLLRSCLEYAGYALHISRNPSLGEVWLKRHDNSNSINRVKNEFSIKNIRNTIKITNIHIEEIFADLYKRAIHFGGHPNEFAVTTNTKIVTRPGGVLFQSLYLSGDNLSLDHAIKSTAQCGICALEILKDIFPERFELLGISENILNLRRGL